MKRKVLVTRSQPGADSLAAALKEAGYQPRITSVIRIEATPYLNSLKELENYSLFIFISAAAVRLATEIISYLQGDKNPEIYAIGPETERQLRLVSLNSNCPERADSEGLLALTSLLAIGGKRVLIICGRRGRETLQQQLRDRGAEVDRAEVYQRLPAPVVLQDMGDLDAVIISSGEGLRCFLNLIRNIPGQVLEQNPGWLPMLVPSHRVANQARIAGVKDIIVCEGASSEAVLCKLDVLFSSA